jgi:CRP/FNR family cyclic AMP-dependent transcriptional regulator
MIDFSKEKDFSSYKKGDQVFSEGDDGDVMYGLVSGEVELRVNGRYLATIMENEIFGEMALMDNSERSASAIAIKPSTVAVISKDRFLEMVKANPDFALEVMSTLAQRLRVELKLHSI